MAPSVRKYFASAHTGKGFCNFADSNLVGLNQVIILKAGSQQEKSALITRIGDYFFKEGFDIDYFCSPVDPKLMEGLTVPKLQAAVIAETPPLTVHPQGLGVVETYANLGIAWNLEKLQAQRHNLILWQQQIKEAYDEAYGYYEKALLLYQQWEHFYADALDTKKAQAFGELLVATLLDYPPLASSPKEIHRFFDRDSLTEQASQLTKCYTLLGRPGTGQSDLLQRLAQQSMALAYHTEIYHCPLSPTTLKMVVLPQLGIAFADAPLPDAQPIDTYQLFAADGTDEAYAAAISPIKKEYEEMVAKAENAISNARKIDEMRDNVYAQATSADVMDGFFQQIVDSFNALRI